MAASAVRSVHTVNAAQMPIAAHEIGGWSRKYPASAPATFGCTVELWVEHHSANNAGYWRGHRSANMAIFPNGEGSGHAYLQIWDWSNGGLYDIQNATPEAILNAHWYPTMCEVDDANYNGSTWTAHDNGSTLLRKPPSSREVWCASMKNLMAKVSKGKIAE